MTILGIISPRVTSHAAKSEQKNCAATIFLQQTFCFDSEIVTLRGPVVAVGLNASHVGPRAAALLLHDGATVERLAQ